MSQSNEIKLLHETKTGKPQVTSYDSGHEHSIEHWFEVRLLMQFEDEEIAVEACRTMAASA
jgi:hypothetical protein